MFMRILTYHQVSTCYLNFVTFFGSSTSTSDPGFGGFKAESTLKQPCLVASKLNRSGHRVQVTYTLRTIEENHQQRQQGTKPPEPKQNGAARKPRWRVWAKPLQQGQIELQSTNDQPRMDDEPKRANKPWVKPQAAIHHQFDPEKGTSLWIMTSPLTPGNMGSDGKRFKSKSKIWDEYLGEYIKKEHKENKAFSSPSSCLSTSFGVHLKLASWCIGDCAYYVQYVEEEIEKLVGSRAHVFMVRMSILKYTY
jgi:hypothetical protein